MSNDPGRDHPNDPVKNPSGTLHARENLSSLIAEYRVVTGPSRRRRCMWFRSGDAAWQVAVTSAAANYSTTVAIGKRNHFARPFNINGTLWGHRKFILGLL
jgi:hypothetical protein